jgi:2-C-methyl-D-erythritol 4-phosphate cytidylyltransferase / 2-C-methyl-D-erythritol 2,4-cyclodiphosphate synthase
MTGRSAAPRVWAVVPAAGRGERFTADLPKQYAPLLGAPMLEWTLRRLLAETRIEAIVVVVAPPDERWPLLANRLASSRLLTASGGADRQSSVLNGLQRLADIAQPHDWVLVHDAARPCLAAKDLGDLIDALVPGAPGAMLAAPLVDTIKREEAGVSAATVDRQGLWRALTPQAFGYAALVAGLEEAARAGVTVTDEAQAMERRGVAALLVPGSAFNIKVTQASDLLTAAKILRSMGVTAMRIGQGFDVHAFGAGNFVTLGGVRILHSNGVVAHSDGDVVIHALCDALLGALAQGDIGQHFPDTDPRYRGADSRVFLRDVAALVRSAGLQLINADITVIAEAPRIGAHRAAMAANLAADLGVALDRINIKATTTERLGFIGRGEGLAAQAAVLLDALGA